MFNFLSAIKIFGIDFNTLNSNDRLTAIIAVFALIVSILVGLTTIIISIIQTRHFQADTFMNIGTNYREMMMSILSSEDLLEEYQKDKTAQTNRALIATFFINHVYGQYYYRKRKLIRYTVWRNFYKDIKGTFCMDAVVERWKINSKYYSKDFQCFINKVLKQIEKDKNKQPLPVQIEETQNEKQIYKCPCPCRNCRKRKYRK